MNKRLQKMLVPLAPLFSRHQKAVLKLRFKKSLGRSIQKPPRSFYDKVFWMSANCDTSSWTELADKLSVRQFVAEKCGKELLPNLYAVYSTADEVDFDALPGSFVVKTNNGCGTNYIVRSKDLVDFNQIVDGLRSALSFPYGELTGQLHYSRIQPKIIAEELLFNAATPNAVLTDYKFYCFNGVPEYCYVVSDRVFNAKHSHKRMMYDVQWKPLPEAFKAQASLAYTDRPSCFDEMLSVAGRLSEGFAFVRVDLYCVDGLVKFSEMTFMPGMDPGFTEEFQARLGADITLPVK